MVTVLGILFLHKIQQSIRTSRWSRYLGSPSYTKSTINQGQGMVTVTGFPFLHKVNNQSGPGDGHRNRVPLPTQKSANFQGRWSLYPGSVFYSTANNPSWPAVGHHNQASLPAQQSINANWCHHSPHLVSTSSSKLSGLGHTWGPLPNK